MMVTLTGTFTRLDGTPATGTVKVTPSRSPIMDPDGKIVISGPQTFPLDKDGKLTTEIPASNDPDLGPPFTYAIDVNLTHANWKISKVWIPYGSTTVDLSEIGDYTPVPGVATRVVTIPADGTDGQVLVWDGAGFSWDFPPEGPPGPAGDVDAEQLAGAPRLTNEVHDKTWVTWSNSTINSQSDRLVKFTVTARNGYIRISHRMDAGVSYYFTAEVKTTSDRVYIGTSPVPVYHSGSGNWERLTGRATQSVDDYLMARDGRSSGWDQIEVRDPVLINLTEVFGAGREPTKEYMDALLAKHGNYVGAVDQFAFGDALQALTVAGPGLALRHDTSVGERVFLDHPGGSTMLHGDTGWRNITSICAGIESGTVLIRRTTTEIQWQFRSVVLTPGTGTLQISPTLTTGWRALWTQVVSTVAHTTVLAERQNFGLQPGFLWWLSQTVITSGGSTSGTRPEAPISGIISAPADPPWPTAFIGTPA